MKRLVILLLLVLAMSGCSQKSMTAKELNELRFNQALTASNQNASVQEIVNSL